MLDTAVFDGTFWITMGGLISASLAGAILAMNKSKCTNLRVCWGLFEIQRDTEAEAKIEMELKSRL